MRASVPSSRVRALARRVGPPVAVVALVWTACAGRVLVLSRPVQSPDAIVSLASHEWERLPAAAAAAVRFPSAHVLLTLPSRITVYNCHDCSHRVARLVGAGVSASRVRILPLNVGGTRGEAEASRNEVVRARFKRVLVITSPYHTRRTLAVFRSAFSGTGVEVGIEPASRYSQARPWLWWTALYDIWYVTYEWAASTYYALRYQIWPVLDFAPA